MENKGLLETLKQLHDDLSQTERVDAEELALMQTLTRDIERVLSKGPDGSSGDAEPASSRLRDLLLKFEAEHPEAAAAIGKVADGLAAMGF
jgi:Domain of unknown function (DUF4404)